MDSVQVLGIVVLASSALLAIVRHFVLRREHLRNERLKAGLRSIREAEQQGRVIHY